MAFNPFIELWRNPILVLAAISYTLFLLGLTFALAGYAWEDLLWLANSIEYRQTERKFGPKWEYVIPRPVYLKACKVCLIAAIWVAAWGGVVYMVNWSP